MLAFSGGVPGQIVSDTLRAGITRAGFYEKLVNRTYADMATHDGTAVIPPRPCKPRDKAKVEVGVQGVQGVQRRILARLRNRRFFALAELNQAIHDLVGQLKDRPMRGWDTSRRALYEPLDRLALRPLPAVPYDDAAWKRCQVNLDDHVESEKPFHSVPFRLLGEAAAARVTAKTVQIFHRGKRARQAGAASGLQPICAACGRIGRPRLRRTCRVRTGATATGRTRRSCAKPPRSALTPRR
jgi:hypothetical protein